LPNPDVSTLDPVPEASIAQYLLSVLPGLFGGLFAASSWAIGRLPGTRRAALRDSLSGGAQRALDRYIAAGSTIEARWLVIRSFGVTLSGVLLATELPRSLGAWLPVVAAGLAVVAYAVPAEIMKALAARSPERSAPLLLQVLRPVELLASPIAGPTLWLGELVGSLFAKPEEPPHAVTETEVTLIVNQGEKTGALDREQSEMIRNVLEFRDATAADVMTNRTQVSAVEVSIPLPDLLKLIAESAHSRYPVYRETIDNVVGVLHAKDVLLKVAQGGTLDGSLESILRPVAFVPETQTAASVLKDMRAGRHHMAVVIDEFGGVTGLLTLEDLLEEIVGDIRDEHDVEEAPIVDLGDGRLMVDASLPISDLSRYLGTELPDEGDYHSLGGFLVSQFGRVPEIGAQVQTLGFLFVVRDADEKRVTKVEIHREAPPASIVPRASRVSAA
jgi:putative hemolysin